MLPTIRGSSALDGQVLKLPLDRHRNTGLQGLCIDEDLLVGVLYHRNIPFTCDKFLRGALNFLRDGLGGFFRQINRCKSPSPFCPFCHAIACPWAGTTVAVFLVAGDAAPWPNRYRYPAASVRLVFGANDFLLVLFCIMRSSCGVSTVSTVARALRPERSDDG